MVTMWVHIENFYYLSLLKDSLWFKEKIICFKGYTYTEVKYIITTVQRPGGEKCKYTVVRFLNYM